MFPSSNILDMALTLIYPQSVTYTPFLSRALNNLGLWVASYGEPKTIRGSFQPIPRTLYQNLGLDFKKNYANFYTSKNILDVGRDVTCDKIEFQGSTYACESITPWFGIDGWVAVLCVEVSAEEFAQRYSERFA